MRLRLLRYASGVLGLASLIAACLIPFQAYAYTYQATVLNGTSQAWYRNNQSLGNTTGLTVSLWVKFSTAPTTWAIFASNRNYGTNDNWEFGVDSSVKWFVQVCTTSGGCHSEESVSASFTSGTWYNLVFTWDGTHKYVYQNNTQIAQTCTSCSGTMTNDTNAPIVIGAGDNSGTFLRFTAGDIADVRIWGRALSSTEVSNLYTDPCNFSNGSNLEAWYLFDGDGTDGSGNGYTLTGQNSPTFTSSGLPYSCSAAISTQAWFNSFFF